jgi:hypothetical protein
MRSQKTPRAPHNMNGQALGLLLKMTADRINARRPPPERKVTPAERKKYSLLALQVRKHERAIKRLKAEIVKGGLDLNHDDQLTVHYREHRELSSQFAQHQANSRTALQALKLQAYLDMPGLTPKAQHRYVINLRKQLEVL